MTNMKKKTFLMSKLSNIIVDNSNRKRQIELPPTSISFLSMLICEMTNC